MLKSYNCRRSIYMKSKVLYVLIEIDAVKGLKWLVFFWFIVLYLLEKYLIAHLDFQVHVLLWVNLDNIVKVNCLDGWAWWSNSHFIIGYLFLTLNQIHSTIVQPFKWFQAYRLLLYVWFFFLRFLFILNIVIKRWSI